MSSEQLAWVIAAPILALIAGVSIGLLIGGPHER